MGRSGPQRLLHLLRGLPPDERLPLPCPPQVSGLRTNVLLTVLRRGCQHLWRQFDLPGFCPMLWYYPAWITTSPFCKSPDWPDSLSTLTTADLFWSHLLVLWGVKVKLKVCQFTLFTADGSYSRGSWVRKERVWQDCTFICFFSSRL